ncbi:hypothetical protein, partial [uncultured Parasutterella sp.]|uniref:hypothetical protein n=1 Tax=uncultured Parasutterella sp. TaxID=1263098 RepID=UPI00272A802E
RLCLTSVLPFIVKNVISITVGIGVFLLAYSYLGHLEVFKEVWISYVVLAFCILLSISVFVLVKGVLRFIAQAFRLALNVRETNRQRSYEESYRNRQWEDAVISRVRALPTPTQLRFKSAGSESFEVIGHDLTINELSELGAVKVINRTARGLWIILTEKGIAAVRKKSDLIY